MYEIQNKILELVPLSFVPDSLPIKTNIMYLVLLHYIDIIYDLTINNVIQLAFCCKVEQLIAIKTR